MTALQVSRVFRNAVCGLGCAWCLSCTWGQIPSVEPARPNAPVLWRPFAAPNMPSVRLATSSRLRNLIRAGNLYLTVQDAIALVLESNIDIEVARYNPFIATWQVQRAEAGGPVPGVRSAASLVGSVAAGQGVSGAESASGLAPSASGAGNRTANAPGLQGAAPPVLDPVLQQTTVFSHISVPQVNLTVSSTPVLISNTSVYSTSLQQGFLTGGSLAVSYTEHYLNENAPTDILNPTAAPNIAISFQQNLLRGFGVAVNARAIKISKIAREISDLTFKTQVTSAVVQTLNLYYGLVAGIEEIKARQSALESAEMLYQDSRKLVQIRAVPPLGLTAAASHVAATQSDLVVAQTVVQQQEVMLKNLLSRMGSADPVLRDVRILPLDGIAMPEKENLPSVDAMIQQALENRSDLAADKLKERSAEIDALGSKNALLPLLQVSGGEGLSGLAGERRTVVVNKVPVQAALQYSGGIGTALGQVFRRDSPTDRVGLSAQAPLFNRQAQADYGIDQLSIRQIQLGNQKGINQMEVDLMNALLELDQARAQYAAAVKNRVLQKDLLNSEQDKLHIGASTPYLVMQAQRDFATAQSLELAALVFWKSARITLDQILGITLESNHVLLSEAVTGTVP
jgi:outer membrane protein